MSRHHSAWLEFCAQPIKMSAALIPAAQFAQLSRSPIRSSNGPEMGLTRHEGRRPQPA